MTINNVFKPDENRKKSNYTGFTFDIEVIPPTEREIKEIEIKLTQELASYLVDRLQREVPDIISYTDFFGEAEEYLRRANKPWIYRKQVAKVMYNNFLEALGDSAYFDTSQQCLYIANKYLTSFDYGDYYSPAYEIIKKLMVKWIDEGNKKH